MLEEEVILTGDEATKAILEITDGDEKVFEDIVKDLEELKDRYISFGWTRNWVLYIFYRELTQQLLAWFLKLAKDSDDSGVLTIEGGKLACRQVGLSDTGINVAYFNLLD